MSVFDAFRLGGRPRRFAASEDPFGMPQERTVGYDNIQPVGFVEPGVVDVAQFASGIRPVQIVDSLPALPDTDYPVGSVVYLTTDGKLYRNVADAWTAEVAAADGGIESVATLPVLPDTDYPVGSVVYLTTDGKLYRNVANAWTAAVPATDITGQITSTQITDDAITTPKIAANAVTAGEIAANAVTAGKILSGAVTTDKLDAGAVTAAKIATGTITANELAADSVTSAKLAADSVVAGKIAAAAVSTDELAANAVTADKLAANSVHVGNMLGNPGNSCPNPSFEFLGSGSVNTYGSDVPGWDINSTDHQVTDGQAHGTGKSLQLRHVGSAKDSIGATFPAVGGRRYRLSFWYRGSSGNPGTGQTIVIIRELDASGAATATTFRTVNPATSVSWAEHTHVLALNANTTSVHIDVRGNGSNGDFSFVDDIDFHQADMEVNAAAGSVAITASGVAITNGALTVASDSGSTVIIDGTSQMFKIVATGTTTTSAFSAATGSNIRTVTHTTNLGSGFRPASATYLLADIGGVDLAVEIPWTYGSTYFYAGTAAPNATQTTIYIIVQDTVAGGTAQSYRYYIHKEAGI